MNPAVNPIVASLTKRESSSLEAATHFQPRVQIILLLSALLVLLLPEPTEAANRQESQGEPPILERAQATLQDGDFDGARRLFQQVLRSDARSVPALIGLGRSMIELPGGGDRALRYLTQAARLAPDDPAPHYYKALAHIHLAASDLGRDNAKRALDELGRVTELDPSHPEAYYHIGMLLREEYQRFDEAAESFDLQMVANPQHMDARQQLLEMRVLTGNWRAALRAGEVIIGREPERAEAYPYLAAAQWYLGRTAEALATFDGYFKVAEESERDLYSDLGTVLTPEEQAEFEDLDQDGRRHYRDRYWLVRDPNPRTEVNERLLEHYIRIAYSRIEFGQNTWPWDERGSVYVRYGEPDVRTGWGRPYAEELLQDALMTARRRDLEQSMGLPLSVIDDENAPRARASRTPERWVYFDRGIDLSFHDPVMSDRFLVRGNRGRLLVDQMEERLPVLSIEEDRILRLDPMQSLVTFKGSEGKTALDYAFALLPEDFGIFRSPTGVHAEIDIGVQLFTPGWKPVTGASETDRRVETIPQVRVRGVPLFVDATRLEADPGDYVLTTILLDPGSGARATVTEKVELPDYSGSTLMISDILPAAGITEVGPDRQGRFIRGDLEVLPLPGGTLQSDQSLFLYYEIYNLTKDSIGATDYLVEYAVFEVLEEVGVVRHLLRGIRNLFRSGDALAGLSSTVTSTGIRAEVPSYIELDMGLAPPGSYELQVIVTDQLTGARTSNSMRFRTLPDR